MHKAISVLKAPVENLCLCFAPQVDEVPQVPSREGAAAGGDGLGVNLSVNLSEECLLLRFSNPEYDSM